MFRKFGPWAESHQIAQSASAFNAVVLIPNLAVPLRRLSLQRCKPAEDIPVCFFDENQSVRESFPAELNENC
jgi:hypothetical protein